VSCGCVFDGKGCSNTDSACPAFSDPGLNFGNGTFLAGRRPQFFGFDAATFEALTVCIY
jgi:hypothetical protein